jgi:hypothetical protein
VRFHKAKGISAADAGSIIETCTSSHNANVVLSHNDDWYDVRLMTGRELENFMSDLLREERAALQSGLITPH